MEGGSDCQPILIAASKQLYMSYVYRINQLTFSDKTVLDLPNLTVLVGPNNCGKSRALKDIVKLTCSREKDIVVVNQALPSIPQNAKTLMDNYGVTIVPSGIYKGNVRFLRPDLQNEDQSVFPPHLKWPKDFDHIVRDVKQFGPGFAGQLTALLSTENRLTIVSQSRSAGDTSEAQNLLQVLYSSGSAQEKEIRNLVKKAFPGVDIALDFSSPQQLEFRVGKDFASLPPDPRDARAILEKCDRLDEQGDGLRSYVGIVVALSTLKRSVFLIDEPEAFLHPPQAFRLGQFIASQASSNRQIVVATHSADVLRGIIFQSSDAQIVRVDRIGDSNAIKLLDPAELKALTLDPLLSAAGVLDGLFCSGVVVTEADADSRFFQSVSTKINSGLDLHYVNADNKQTVPKVLAPYKKLGVRCAGIVDIDVLNDAGEFKRQLVAAGVTGADYESALASRQKIEDEIKSTPSIERLNNALEQISKAKIMIEEVLSKSPAEHERVLSEIKRILKRIEADTSAWQVLKKFGIRALPNSHDEFIKLYRICSAAGLFIIPSGELETILSEHGIEWQSDKRVWINRALQLVPSLQVETEKQPWKFTLDIINHLQKG